MKVTRTITIDKFIELWDNLIKGDFDAIAPNLGNEIRNIWGQEILERFLESKKGGSYGNLGDSTQLAQMMRTFQNPGAKIAYNKNYASAYPLTYVKTGDLRDKMQIEVRVPVRGFDGDTLMIRINIPEMDNQPFGRNISWDWKYCYAHLEEWRSFIRSSLLLAWPKMLKHILNNIGD